MAIPIAIPRLGWNMEEGTFGGWLKIDGEEVHAGDRLFVLESEKAAEEIETLDGGILRIRGDGPSVGDVVAVGTVIGYLVESIDSELPVAQEPTAPVQSEPVERPSPVPMQQRDQGNSPVTPRALRVAAELSIDVSVVRGTGRGGRIRERDVRAAAAIPSPQPPDRSGEGEKTLITLTPTRRLIATRMVASQRATAPVTLTTTIDATNLVKSRDWYKTAGGVAPSFTDLIVKYCAVALLKHRVLGAQWTDDGIRIPASIDIGIAVDTEDGLRVPVVRDVPSLSNSALAECSRALIERARTGRLTKADMHGGCFTVSNLGVYGVDAFTPIINYPECAVLGVGRIARRPAVVGDAIVARDQVTLSLTFDHRIVDGAPAARFLQTLSQAIEQSGKQP